jgi:predicted transcriptional regulator
MRVLLSIKPEHAQNIFEGKKTFEFRRKLFARREIKTVLVYATKPVGRFIGEFEIESILEDEPHLLWNSTHEGSGISKGYFDEYFSGRSVGYALQIGELRRFDDPIDPSAVLDDFTPPQSFMYVGGVGSDIHRVEGPRLL